MTLQKDMARKRGAEEVKEWMKARYKAKATATKKKISSFCPSSGLFKPCYVYGDEGALAIREIPADCLLVFVSTVRVLWIV